MNIEDLSQQLEAAFTEVNGLLIEQVAHDSVSFATDPQQHVCMIASIKLGATVNLVKDALKRQDECLATIAEGDILEENPWLAKMCRAGAGPQTKPSGMADAPEAVEDESGNLNGAATA